MKVLEKIGSRGGEGGGQQFIYCAPSLLLCRYSLNIFYILWSLKFFMIFSLMVSVGKNRVQLSLQGEIPERSQSRGMRGWKGIWNGGVISSRTTRALE